VAVGGTVWASADVVSDTVVPHTDKGSATHIKKAVDLIGGMGVANGRKYLRPIAPIGPPQPVRITQKPIVYRLFK
jgi:hypothetical protein